MKYLILPAKWYLLTLGCILALILAMYGLAYALHYYGDQYTGRCQVISAGNDKTISAWINVDCNGTEGRTQNAEIIRFYADQEEFQISCRVNDLGNVEGCERDKT